MVEDNVKLIQRFLDGEEEAFVDLVKKHQKRIHALAWRKLGDYHIAEEITQDTFIQVYKKLSTLKDHKQFDGWIYVIANRLCINWIKRKKTSIQSLEGTPAEEIEMSYYRHYESKQREIETTELYRDIARKLLETLPESERTVLTLYHLSEMTPTEISKFLGVSVNTIKSRLRRAQNRLKGKEHLVSECLRSVQLSTDLTGSIMQQIADIKPTPPIAKPTLPWAAFGTAAVLVMLLLGAMHQYIVHFQQPYNFEALSEPTIEILDSPIHIDIVSIPAERNKIGRGVINSKREGAGATVSDDDSAANVQVNSFNSPVKQWTQANGPQGSPLFNLFATSENKIHAISSTGIYRLADDETAWMNINPSVPISSFQSPITEYQGVIYSVNTNNIFNSTDSGETWNRFCGRPEGDAVGLVIRGSTPENLIMYLALQNEGVFRTDDSGRKWLPVNNRLTGKRITAVDAIGNSVFIGTNRGLYRLDSGIWHQLPVDPLKTVHSMAVFENNVYIVIGPDFLSPTFWKSNTPDNMYRKVLHSADAGSTWDEITPKDKSFITRPSFEGATKISVSDKTLLLLGIPAFRSNNSGQTWTNLGFDMDFLPSNNSSVLGMNENTFYKIGSSGILRTTDSGDSWHSFTNGIIRTKVQDLVAFSNSLYVYTGTGFFKSSNDGQAWKEVEIDSGELTPKPTSNSIPLTNYYNDSKLITTNNELYGIIPQEKVLRIFRLHPSESVFSIVHEISSPTSWTKGVDWKDTSIPDATEGLLKTGGFAVSSNTFYIEYMRRLFKWTLGSIEVIDTGLIDTETDIDDGLDRGFKLAASTEVVYVGKRNGKLFQSIDGGKSWRDVTLNIPFNFTSIKDIMFIEDHVYVATDRSVLTSQTGEHWRVVMDQIGTNIIIDKFAVYGSNFYGADDKGVYSLDSRGRWKQISDNIPDKVISLSASHDKLYIGTEKRGIFHISLEAPQEISAAALK